jgi:hypothetical protein
VTPPSEVPTAPGNDARAGAARAAALRALALVDDEVTAQRDVAVLNRLRELKDLAVDDLDEDTSVIPGLTIKEATAAAVAAKKSAEAQEEARRAASRQPPAGQGAPARSVAAAEDDRPTPPDPDSELSATTPPETSRTSAEATANLSGDTGRYSAIDALWVTSDAGGPSSRGRSLTVQNPAAALEAAAADAAVAAAHAHGAARRAPEPALVAAPPVAVLPVAASPVCAFRVAVLAPDRPGGEVRVTALATGAAPPPGATAAMLVATTEAESAELARIFGYVG